MDFRYLTETKNEFNNYLCSILVPHLYNGISGMLEYSIQTYNMLEEKQKKNKNIQNPGIINIFKMCLNDISSINNNEIENEYKRIKDKSGCGDWFDNLIKASFKSYVLFLTWDPKTSNSKYSENDFYDKISLKDFIHKCYIETCEYFKENPEIFLKKNVKKEIFDIIKNCVESAIRKTLPYNEIIQEFLKINFMAETDNNEKSKKEIDNIKNLVFRFISQNKYGARPTGKALLSDSSGKNYNKYDQDSNFGRRELEEYINIGNVDPVVIQHGGESNNSSFNSEKREIFRPHSVTNSKHNSLKSKSNSETSDNFQVPEMGNRIMRSSRSTHNSTNKDSEKDIMSKSSKTSRTTKTNLHDYQSEKESEIELGTGYREITNDDNYKQFDKQNGGNGNISPSTQIMTRSEAKHKELDLVMNKTQLKTSETSESNQHIDSPMAIKKNHIDRIYEEVNPHNKMTGGNLSKRKIQIIKNKSNSIHDKVNNMNNYFNNLISN